MLARNKLCTACLHKHLRNWDCYNAQRERFLPEPQSDLGSKKHILILTCEIVLGRGVSERMQELLIVLKEGIQQTTPCYFCSLSTGTKSLKHNTWSYPPKNPAFSYNSIPTWSQGCSKASSVVRRLLGSTTNSFFTRSRAKIIKWAGWQMINTFIPEVCLHESCVCQCALYPFRTMHKSAGWQITFLFSMHRKGCRLQPPLPHMHTT